MSLWKLYYHLVWSTHERLPLITPKREAPLYQYCNDKANALGAHLHAIGGIDNHVHLIVSIPPKIAIAEFVRRIKGSSSHYLNSRYPDDDCGKFKWQQNYGVFSLGRKQLDFAIAYTQNQKQHHLNHTTLHAIEPKALLESPD
ncbi:MAG: IS200/IS605 family transposase [Cyanobacteria bacterium P01_D01_bin.1]